MDDIAQRLLGAPGEGEEVRERWFDPVLHPVCRVLAAVGMTPAAVSMLSLAAAFGAFYVLVQQGQLQRAMLLVIASYVLDGLDGSLARLTNSATSFGAFLDRLVDRTIIFVLYLALVMTNLVAPELALAVLFLFMLTDYVRLRLKLDFSLSVVEATGGRVWPVAGWLISDFDASFQAGVGFYVLLLVLQADALRREWSERSPRRGRRELGERSEQREMAA